MAGFISSLAKVAITDIENQNNFFIAKVKGLKDEINRTIGELYGPLCRATFCDQKCKLNAGNYSFLAKIDSVINNTTFQTNNPELTKQDEGYFDSGIIEFLDGNNKGYRGEIKQFSNGVFKLMFELPYKLSPNDEFKALAGCDKLFKTCCQKFNNAVNFRGEPHLPGIEVLLKFL